MSQDYFCGERTQDDHNGTDIMLSDQIKMHEGVAILAAADGIVSRLRDGMEDRAAPGEEVRRVAGRECGNSMIIEHEGGWQTQYCHLRRGSLTVAQGDRVRRGDPIGLVGLSGATEFPHLHFVLRHRGDEIDPFDGKSIHQACGKDHQPLWAEEIPYTPFLLLPVGLGTNVVHKDDIWTGYHMRDRMPKTIPSLVLTSRIWGGRRGDLWEFQIVDPNGEIFFQERIQLNTDNQFRYVTLGRKRPKGGFKTGMWSGSVTLTRGDYRQTQSHQTEIY